MAKEKKTDLTLEPLEPLEAIEPEILNDPSMFLPKYNAKFDANDYISKQKGLNIRDYDDLRREDGYITTQCIAFNAIVSGDIREGLPRGKATFFCGASGSGKSYLAKCAARDAILNKSMLTYKTALQMLIDMKRAEVKREMMLEGAAKSAIDATLESINDSTFSRREVLGHMAKYKDPKYCIVFWWDTEDAIESIDEITSLGVPEDCFKLISRDIDEKTGNEIPWTVESWHVSAEKYIGVVNGIKKEWYAKNPGIDCPYDFIFVLDSLADIPTNKELAEVNRVDSVSDMGGRAKIWRTRFRAFNSLLRSTGSTFIGINHIFENPTNLFATLPEIPGGHFIKFLPQRILWVRPIDIKNEGDDKSIKKFDGINIAVFNYKNRKVLKGTSVKLELKPNGGMNPYSDILALAPELFPPTDQKQTSVSYEWYKFSTSEEVINKFISLSEGAVDAESIKLNDVDVDNVKYLDVTINQTNFNKIKGINKFFAIHDKSETGLIIKTISKTYKKAELYATEEKWYKSMPEDKMSKLLTVAFRNTISLSDVNCIKTDEDKAKYFVVRSTPEMFKTTGKLRKLFTLASEINGGIILKTIPRKFNKVDLFGTEEGEDVFKHPFFTMDVLEKINENIRGWMQLSGDDVDLDYDDEELVVDYNTLEIEGITAEEIDEFSKFL